MTKLTLLDKCVDGDLDRLHELVDPMYDDVGVLFDMMRPFIQSITLEAVS